LRPFLRDSVVQGSCIAGLVAILYVVVQAVLSGVSVEAILLMVFIGLATLVLIVLWLRWLSVWYERRRDKR